MASVALAGQPGPQRVVDNLQTCPTVYKSGMLVLSTISIPEFFCNILSLQLGHGMGLSRHGDIRMILHLIIFAKHNGFRESFSNTECFVCFSGSQHTT
jgi:hypothetical protein